MLHFIAVDNITLILFVQGSIFQYSFSFTYKHPATQSF